MSHLDKLNNEVFVEIVGRLDYKLWELGEGLESILERESLELPSDSLEGVKKTLVWTLPRGKIVMSILELQSLGPIDPSETYFIHVFRECPISREHVIKDISTPYLGMFVEESVAECVRLF